jgi:hypothetical protein
VHDVRHAWTPARVQARSGRTGQVPTARTHTAVPGHVTPLAASRRDHPVMTNLRKVTEAAPSSALGGPFGAPAPPPAYGGDAGQPTRLVAWEYPQAASGAVCDALCLADLNHRFSRRRLAALTGS